MVAAGTGATLNTLIVSSISGGRVRASSLRLPAGAETPTMIKNLSDVFTVANLMIEVRPILGCIG